MDIELITTLISNVGFPIAACCYMAWANHDSSKRHREETAALSKALENNTLVITELKTELEVRWTMNKEDK